MDIFLTATLILVLMASFPRVLVSAQQDAAGGGGDAADVAAGDGGDGGGAAVTNNSTAADSSNSNSATTEKEPAVPEWGGCVMEGTTADTKVTIGATTIVCLQIGNGTDWSAGLSYIRLAFQPTADQYSRLYIPNCKQGTLAHDTKQNMRNRPNENIQPLMRVIFQSFFLPSFIST